MPGIEEPIEVTGSPASEQLDANIERRRDAPDGLERQVIEMPALEPRDRGGREARALGQIELAPAALDSNRANDRPETLIVHVRSVTRGTHPALTHARGTTLTCGTAREDRSGPILTISLRS